MCCKKINFDKSTTEKRIEERFCIIRLMKRNLITFRARCLFVDEERDDFKRKKRRVLSVALARNFKRAIQKRKTIGGGTARGEVARQ